MTDIIEKLADAIEWKAALQCETPHRDELVKIIESHLAGFDLLSLLKPLVWTLSSGASYPIYVAATAFHEYRVHSIKGCGVSYLNPGGWRRCDSIDQGKSLCWQDYVSRVRGLFQKGE